MTADELIVTIGQGALKGSFGQDYNGSKFYKFQGIPFGKPPIGDLRFKPPQPAENWKGVLDATKHGSSCYSRQFFKLDQIIGSEDCLYLNVYTKQLPKSEEDNNLQPVMVWIHGGGFFCGSGDSDIYGPEFLVTEDVVIVTINYRLGILGFLAFEDPSLNISGNAGLKDMVLALKWVQKNISKFNGDPNNVTIFGESAGGAACQLLMLSPMSKGLFHKVIAQSGSALNPWVQGNHSTKWLREGLGLGSETNEKLLFQILKSKPLEKLLEIQETVVGVMGNRPFGVIIEKNSTEPFLDEDPIDIILQKKFHQVPYIGGFVTAEGMCFELFKSPNSNYEENMPEYLGYEKDCEESKKLIEKIQDFYYKGEKPKLDNKAKRFTMDTDLMFLYGIYCTIKKYSTLSSAPVYFYRISLETSLNLFKKLLRIKEPGTSHVDDIGYLFKGVYTPDIEEGSIEDISVKRFVKLWTNFARDGNPTPFVTDLLATKWEPVTEPDNLKFIDIGSTLQMLSNPEPERLRFWDKIYQDSPNKFKYA